MRYAIFSVLVVLPVALAGWIFWKGGTDTRNSRAEAAASVPVAPKGETRTAGPEQNEPPTAPPKDEDAVLKALFARPLVGTTVDGSVELYDEKGLFDYINGAAPIFIERSFRKLGAAEMKTADGGELTCDIYDMRTPENATSIFEKERSDVAKPVADWPEAITGRGSFVFHHTRYYVKLTAFDPASEAVLPQLAAALRDRIK